MDYFQMVILSCQIVLLIIYFIWGKRFTKKKRQTLADIKRQNDYFSRSMEDMTLDIFDKIEELEYEVNEIHKQLMRFHQQQIGWITLKKEYPQILHRVLLLHTTDKTEHIGYLNSCKSTWTTQRIGGKSDALGIDEFSHWKTLVEKQNGAKS